MRQRGAITIFFSIIFLALVVFLGAVVDSARLFSARNHLRMTVDTMIFSELTKYNRDLYDQYGLFAFDWGGNERIGNLFAGFHENAPYEEQLLQFLNEQLMPLDGPDLYGYEVDSLSVNAHYSLNDNNVMRHQILEHMKYRAPTLFIADLLGLAGELQQVSEELDGVEKTIGHVETFYELVDILVNINREIDGGSLPSEDYDKETRTGLNELMRKDGERLRINYPKYLKLIRDYFNLQDELSALQDALAAAEDDEEEDEIRALISEVRSEIRAVRRDIQDTYDLIVGIAANIQRKVKVNDLRGMLGAVPKGRDEAITALNELIEGAADEDIKLMYEGWLTVIKNDLPAALSTLESELSVLQNEIATFGQRFEEIAPSRLDSIVVGNLDPNMHESLRHVFSKGLSSFKGIIDGLNLENDDYDKGGQIGKLGAGDILKIVQNVIRGNVSFGFDFDFAKPSDIVWGDTSRYSDNLPSSSETYEDEEPGLRTFLATIQEVAKLFSDMSGLIVDSVEQLYINQYAFDNFSTQADVRSVTTEEYETLYADQVLKSQVEYLVFGKDSDEANNKAANLSIGIIRAVLNVPYIFTDATMFKQVTMITAKLSAATLGFGYVLIKGIVIAAWACIEAMFDVIFLANGETVPLIKTSGDWFSNLDGLIEYLASAVFEEKEPTKKLLGWDYNNYLNLVVLIRITTHDDFLGRIQDLIYMESDRALDSRHLFTYMQIEADVKVRNWFISMPLIESLDGTPSEHTIISVDMYRGY